MSARRTLALAAGLLAAAGAARGEDLARFADDYPAALAAARARDVPIFVDVWAPW